MNKFRSWMIKYPFISCAVIFPFVFALTFVLFSLFFEIILPVIVSFWITSFIYNIIVHGGINSPSNINIWKFKNFD